MSRLVLMVALTTSLCAQQQPAFEAASIKIFQDIQPGRGIGGRPSGSRLRLENETLARLICYSYNIEPWQVVEGPAWAAVPRGVTFALAPHATSYRPATERERSTLIPKLL